MPFENFAPPGFAELDFSFGTLKSRLNVNRYGHQFVPGDFHALRNLRP
jgi:hypothetical protein